MAASTLARARAGDEIAFRDLTAPYLRELHLHCYRMLGSVVDADDLLQETLIAAWRGLDDFEGRGSVRAWMYRIATTRCLNAIRDGRRRRPAEPEPPFVPPTPSRRNDVTWLQPYPDAWLEQLADATPGPLAAVQARETIELAFIAALQRLPPRQAAVLILVDVLGFSLLEVAGMLGTTRTAVKGALQRARRGIARDDDDRTGAPASGSPAELDLARRFADAFTRDDVEGVVALLSDRASLAMPPAPHVYEGRGAIAAFLRASARWRGTRRFHLALTRANGQPAFTCDLTAAGGSRVEPVGVIVLTLSGDRVRAITRFLDPELTQTFGRVAPIGQPAFHF